MKWLPVSIRYILSVYVLGLCFFTSYRGLLLAINFQQLSGIPDKWKLIASSMLMGFRFDTTVSGYLLVLPLLLLLIAKFGQLLKNWLFTAVHTFICILYIPCLFVCAADIPFYNNYSNCINVTILNWTGSPMFMIKMIWQDRAFMGYFMLFLVSAVLFVFFMHRLYKRFKPVLLTPGQHLKGTIYVRNISVSLLFIGIMLLAIRGRTDEKSPIVPGTAYTSNYNLPNQAGLNPVFNLMWSWTDGWKDENKPLSLINDSTALQNVRTALHLPDTAHSIYRTIINATPQQNYNVVLVLMESMTASYMHFFGNGYNLTPNLDSLALHGYCFSNFYSAGIHTFNGIFSTLYGYPALMAHHTMEGAVIPHYTGLPCLFSGRGYETIYFTTHDDQFDNAGGFLRTNCMHTVISKKDYPANEIVSTLGVPDHYMFGYSVPVLNKLHDNRRPFFAVFMTSSNHNPYVVPPHINFTPRHTDVRGGCVEYADWAIGDFMKKAAAMPWYNNTIFVFLGDHGTYDGMSYNGFPFAYSHIPCIIYSPMLRTNPQVITTPAGQIDVFPTIAGMLGGNYTNNTMGVDILHGGRKWIFFSQDDKIAVADTSYLYVWQKTGPEAMYTLASNDAILQRKRMKADSMKTYAFSMIQAAQWLRNNGKTGQNAGGK